MRVGDSVIRYKGQPVFITKVFNNDEGTMYVSFINLITREKRARVFLKSKFFDYTAFPIGYVNSDALGALYLERRAVRKYKSGLNTGNLHFREEDPKPRDILYSKGLGKTIMNDFPSVPVAYEKAIKKGSHKVAFNREFAFNFSNLGIVYLDYKGQHVGFVKATKNNDVHDIPCIQLGIDFMHMKQELEHKGINLI